MQRIVHCSYNASYHEVAFLENVSLQNVKRGQDLNVWLALSHVLPHDVVRLICAHANELWMVTDVARCDGGTYRITREKQ